MGALSNRLTQARLEVERRVATRTLPADEGLHEPAGRIPPALLDGPAPVDFLTGGVVVTPPESDTACHGRKNRRQTALSPQRRTPCDRSPQQAGLTHRRAENPDRHAPLH